MILFFFLLKSLINQLIGQKSKKKLQNHTCSYFHKLTAPNERKRDISSLPCSVPTENFRRQNANGSHSGTELPLIMASGVILTCYWLVRKTKRTPTVNIWHINKMLERKQRENIPSLLRYISTFLSSKTLTITSLFCQLLHFAFYFAFS